MNRQPQPSLHALVCCAIGALWAAGSAQAALQARLGGQAVYDTDRNITWLANANLALSNDFGIGYISINPSSGTMSLATAQAYIAAMNAVEGGQGYLGVNQWRLPDTVTPDTTCTQQPATDSTPSDTAGYNCTLSEMAHLFYAELGGLAGSDLTSQGPFSNIADAGNYWTDEPAALGAWVFSFSGGLQLQANVSFGQARVFPVVNGDVGGGGPNNPPTADAGPDQLVIARPDNCSAQITLNGSASSDSDGSIVSYVWTLDDIPYGNTAVVPNVFVNCGVSQFRLQVTDNDGATDTDTVVITVTAPPDVVQLLTLPSAGGTTAPEAVVLTKSAAPVTGSGFVKDYASAAALGAFGTTPELEPKDAAVVPDQNGNSVDDIAVLLDDPVTNKPKVEIRDPLTGKKLRNINYNTDHEAVALAIIADQNGNQTPEGVVLANRGGERPRLLIRDLGTTDPLPTVSLPRTVRPLGLVMAEDFSGNGAPEALVLLERKSNGRGYVFVWDIGGAGKVATVRLPGGNAPLNHAVFSGPGGLTSVAVLARRVSDDRGKLFVYDAFTGAPLWGASLVGGREPVAVRAYVPASGGPRLAVLQARLSDETPIVTVYQGDTGAVVTNVVYGSGQTPIALEVLPDLALDSGSEPEFSVLMQDDVLRIRVRDSVSRDLIQTLSVP